MVDILINSVYLYDNEDGTQKMTVLLNVQNGQETVQIDTLEEGSSIEHMVRFQGLGACPAHAGHFACGKTAPAGSTLRVDLALPQRAFRPAVAPRARPRHPGPASPGRWSPSLVRT